MKMYENEKRQLTSYSKSKQCMHFHSNHRDIIITRKYSASVAKNICFLSSSPVRHRPNVRYDAWTSSTSSLHCAPSVDSITPAHQYFIFLFCHHCGTFATPFQHHNNRLTAYPTQATWKRRLWRLGDRNRPMQINKPHGWVSQVKNSTDVCTYFKVFINHRPLEWKMMRVPSDQWGETRSIKCAIVLKSWLKTC